MNLTNREEARAFLREHFGDRIKFSRTMDAELPPRQNYSGGVEPYRFIVLLAGQMMECQVLPNKEINCLPGYQESDQNRIDDWE